MFQASKSEFKLHLDEANKLAQELNDHTKSLKAAMFNYKFASFIAFPSIGEGSLGELAFTPIKLPFETLDIANKELKPIDIRDDYDFLLPLEHGQRIVTFKSHKKDDPFGDETFSMQMNCFDQLGRLIGTENIEHYVRQENVTQCGTKQFVVNYDFHSPKLSVYNSSLHRLRSVDCKKFSNICSNSKFIFGLWDSFDSFDSDEDDDDDNNDNDSDEQQEEEYSYQLIQARHSDTLRKAFVLCVPEKYTMHRIMADEHHVVVMSRVDSVPGSCHWFMSVFNLQAIYAESDVRDKAGKKTRKIFLAERHVRLDIEPIRLHCASLFGSIPIWLPCACPIGSK